MATPAFGAAGTGAAIATGTTLAIPYPSSPPSGALFIAHILQYDNGDADPTTPSGWTLRTQSSANGHEHFIYSRDAAATGSESGNQNFTVISDADGYYGRMYYYTGDSGTWAFETGGNATGTDDTIEIPSLTTTGADRLAVALIAVSNPSAALASATGETGGNWTESVAEFSSTTGTDATLGVQHAAMASAGTISGGVLPDFGTSDDWFCTSLAIYVVSSGAYTLDADPGSYAITGQAASLLQTSLLAGAAGSYAISGQNATLQKAITLVGEAGGYSISGQNATLLQTSILAAAAGSYAIAGQDATLLNTNLLTAEAGSYAITGNSADLVHAAAGAYSLVADAGSYAIAGQDAGLLTTRLLSAEPGAYSIAGQDAALVYVPVATTTARPPQYGGWSAHEFAKLRRQLARRKRKLTEEVREIIAEAAPVVEVAVAVPTAAAVDTLTPLLADLRAQIAVIEAAATQQALADVAREIVALREQIEDELEDEEALLLLAA